MAENPQFETLTQSLSPTLQSLEQKRKELKKQGQSTGIWVGGVVFVIVSAFSVYINAALIGVGIAAGLALLAYYSCVNAKSQELSSYYKQKVIAQVLQSFCDNAIFTPEEGIKEGIFRSCGLFTSPDRYHTEDLIQGRVGTISFKDSNILIAIPESRNHFEASIWKSIDDLSQLKNDFSMIHALVSIIEDLNLNTRIWTKK